MSENIKQIVGHVTEQTNDAINKYAKKNNLKKIGLIGEIVTNFIKGETNGEETSTKRNQKTSSKKEVN
jgi:hypothetical protein